MSPISMLKEAILNEDWEKVKQAYVSLTGEKLVPTKKGRGRPKNRVDLSIIQDTDTAVSLSNEYGTTNFPLGPRENEFQDDGTVPKEDSIIAKTPPIKRVTQRRPPFRKVKAICGLCGTEDMVNPKDIPPVIEKGVSPYRCVRCTRTR